jgi:hypothetical protein
MAALQARTHARLRRAIMHAAHRDRRSHPMLRSIPAGASQ